jgi:hypothetical protein
MKKRHFIALALLAGFTWYSYTPKPTVISVRIGQPFEEVVSGSTFLVRRASNIPTYDEVGFGVTWVKEPAVIIHFNDPKHGFTLPPTTLAAISYLHNKADTIATSPMLNKLSFSQAASQLALLQRQFQAGEWQLELNTDWFDLSPKGRDELHEYLRNPESGYVKTVSLVVPEKYEMTFRIWCVARCDSNLGFDRYLIDIGVGEDIGFEIRERERQRKEEAMTP